jgi:SAM-dependent methyltransferase
MFPMYDVLREQYTRPAPFSRYTAATLWTDDHISGRMLAHHLDPDTDIASRRAATVDGIVDWIDRTIALSGKSVLDLGCGPGLYATRMAERGAIVTGIDFSERSIAWARNAAAEAGLTIDYRYQDYLAGDLPAGQDLIVLIYGDLCALSPAQRRTLTGKAVYALKPGGAFICDVFSLAQYAEREETATYGRRFMDGFWAAGDYFGFLNTFLYDELKLALDRHLIVEPERTREVFNWLQYFDPRELSEELAEAGLMTEAIVDALTGGPWEDGSRMFAVVARRQ